MRLEKSAKVFSEPSGLSTTNIVKDIFIFLTGDVPKTTLTGKLLVKVIKFYETWMRY